MSGSAGGHGGGGGGCNGCGGGCGCATCCAGVEVLTPKSLRQRAGLPTLSYRIGTHASFLTTMQARLAAMTVEVPGAAGEPPRGAASAASVQSTGPVPPLLLRPLQGLTTRDPADPTMALLDAWATLADVLTFYQQRIANEAYLRTATERRSVLELARLVGYTLRPGVAASSHLAYTVDANQKEPVTIPPGAAAQSVPDPGEQSQTFETSEALLARPEWNKLPVRRTRPQHITAANVLALDTLHVAGRSTNLRPGDKLLLLFTQDGAVAALRVVAAVDSAFAEPRTAVALRPVEVRLQRATAALVEFVAVGQRFPADPSGETGRVLAAARRIVSEVYLGATSDPARWAARVRAASQDDPPPPVIDAIDALGVALEALTKPEAPADPADPAERAVTDPAKFVAALLKPPVVQARSSAHLARSLGAAFGPGVASVGVGVSAGTGAGKGSAAGSASSRASAPREARAFTDVGTQLLVNFVPNLELSYYAAWAGAQLNSAESALHAVYVLRARVALFGAAASKLPTYTKENPDGVPIGLLESQDKWLDWFYRSDETPTNAYLDQALETAAAGGYALAEVAAERSVLRIRQARAGQRHAYGVSGPTTQLTFEPTPGTNSGWRDVGKRDPGAEFTDKRITELRQTTLYLPSEPLTLTDAPITEAVATAPSAANQPPAAAQIQLDGVYKDLRSGRWVILSGERADIDQVSGVQVSELQMISGLSHGFDPALPGDTLHTTLTLATPLAYQYRRDTLTIHANVVKATHGGTRREVLGSGDGAQALQAFTLKQPPLTFVAAPTARGAASSLKVDVDGIEWFERESLAGLGPKDRAFTTLTDDAGSTTLVFGNGVQGARLPSGVENIRAVYRSGIGAGGNVKTGQISVLQTRPLGVTEVVNPLRASGGADRESRDLARTNAPLSVMALDRLVSVQDHADFTRGFAGIAKAVARRSSDGRRELIHMTIAGIDDAPIDPASDLYRNLLDALRQLGDPDLPLRVDLRERKALVLSAKVALQPGRLWERVEADLRATLLDTFGFAQRGLGQPVRLSEVVSAMHGVAGVAWVDVDVFGAVGERVARRRIQRDGSVQVTRELVSQDEIVAAVRRLVQPSRVSRARPTHSPTPTPPPERQPPDVDAWPGGRFEGALRPAEVAAFTPAVPDTLILNQAL